MAEPLASWECPICGTFKDVRQELCPACTELQANLPEEVAAREKAKDFRNGEVEVNVRRLALDYARDYHYDSEGIGYMNDPEACLQELVDYVLGLLK